MNDTTHKNVRIKNQINEKIHRNSVIDRKILMIYVISVLEMVQNFYLSSLGSGTLEMNHVSL